MTTIPHLNVDDFRLLGGLAQRFAYAPGQVVLRRGQRWPALLFVRAGHLRVQHTLAPDEPPVQRLRPGDFLPDLLLHDDGESLYELVAEGNLELDAIDAADLDMLLRDRPDLGSRLMRGLACSLCSHLRFALQLLCDMAFLTHLDGVRSATASGTSEMALTWPPETWSTDADLDGELADDFDDARSIGRG